MSSRGDAMMPTVPIDILAGYAAGAGVALSAIGPLSRTRDALRTRYFVALASYVGIVLLPTGVGLYLAYPDWSLMYLANPAHVSALIALPVIVLLMVAAPLAGFIVTHRLAMMEKGEWIRRSLLLVGALAALTLVTGWRRLLSVAYYESYHYDPDGVVSLFSSPLLLALGVIVPAAAGAYVVLLREVRRHVAATGIPVRVGRRRSDSKADTDADAKSRSRRPS